MRIAEYKQIGTKIVDKTITIPAEYDEEGNILAEEYEKTLQEERPVMGMIYRDMTEEEIAEVKQDEQSVLYDELVSRLIREKYSIDDELAILRQRDVKPEEFAQYNDYAEECKIKAKEILESDNKENDNYYRNRVPLY